VLFRTEAPDISLPPETILTHCRTWICVTSHHYKYFKEIHVVLLQLNSIATVYIKVAKLLFGKNILVPNFVFIYQNYKTKEKKYHIIGKDSGLLLTVVVYPKIYRIQFVKVRITKTIRGLTELFHIS